MQAFLEFRPWPDAHPALHCLSESGIRLALLSDFTGVMLETAVRRCGMQGVFASRLSTDAVRAYKPDPRAYHLALKTLKLGREEIAYAAFGGWDAGGAKTFGFPTFWVNRINGPTERSGPPPDGVGPGLAELASFVHAWNART
jgi:2-haloacid dehalogenase